MHLLTTLGEGHSSHLEQVSVCSLRCLTAALVVSIAAVVVQAVFEDAKTDTPGLRDVGGIVDETEGGAV
jgi:hypothetical protein